MKLIKCTTLFDGVCEKRESFIGFEGTEIKYVGNNKPLGEGSSEIKSEGNHIVVTPAFIDSHSHIGMVRSGEANERMNSVYPLVNALHSEEVNVHLNI